MLVTLNIASVNDSAQAMNGLPFSPTMPSPIANTMLKTTICNTSPVDMASMTDVGTMCSRICCQVCAVAAIGGAPLGCGSVMPTPGCSRLTVTNPISSASVVTIS